MNNIYNRSVLIILFVEVLLLEIRYKTFTKNKNLSFAPSNKEIDESWC
jgi:hypothetical protein